MKSKRPSGLPGLDAMRFYAATMIALFHLVHIAKLDTPAFLDVIKNQFALGVPIFFVISAFGLALGYHGRLNSINEIEGYFSRRFWRIAPLFYFVLAFSLIFHFLAFGTLYSFQEILAKVFFVFNLMPQYVAGIVWASWSIGVEMVFYAILPILLLAINGLRRALIFWIIAVWLGAVWATAFVPPTPELKNFSLYFILAYLHYFAAGIFGYFVFKWVKESINLVSHRKIGILLFVLGLAGLLFTMFAAGSIVIITGLQFYKTFRAISVTLLIVGIALHPVPVVTSSPIAALGRASFSLYLWHPILIYFLDRLGVYRKAFELAPETGIAYLLCAIATFACLIPLSLVTYHIIEKPGMRMASRSYRSKAH